MTKTISTLALTLFAGMTLAAALPAADAEAGAKNRQLHCVKVKKNGKYHTVCPSKRRRQVSTIPTTHLQQTRTYNFTSDAEYGTGKFSGDGAGGGGRGNRSDIRLKRDIAVVGKLPNGLKLYRFKYLWSDIDWVGVMAQDVLKVLPQAVITGSDGFYSVRYDLLGTSMKTLDAWQAETAAIHHPPLAA